MSATLRRQTPSSYGTAPGVCPIFRTCGIQSAGDERHRCPFGDVGRVPSEQIYAEAKKLFGANGGGDCLYRLGAGWDCLKAIAPLERDLNTTVLTNARSNWGRVS